jgi:hypothetical protein
MHHPIAAAWNSKMLRAIKADDARVVQKCLCDGQDPNTAFPNGFTALSYSASNSATACVTLLLTTKASPNIRGLNGNTALHHAVYTEDTQAVQLSYNMEQKQMRWMPEGQPLQTGHRKTGASLVQPY